MPDTDHRSPEPPVYPDPVFPDWPMFGLTDDVRDSLAAERAAGQASALVTLIRTDGGSPRPPGSQMLVSSRTLSGFLSGGCVEADVAAHRDAAIDQESDGVRHHAAAFELDRLRARGQQARGI